MAGHDVKIGVQIAHINGQIQETIVELKDRVTLVIVAHRPSTLDVCSRVISMKAGRIEPAGLSTT